MISKKLKDEIWDYCRLNDITDINNFIERMVQQGYNIEKYGTSPIDFTPEVIEKIVEKEIEVIKEVPVEVIKEIEKEVIKEVIKEVPVEKIIEKEVVKKVYITDDETIIKLQKELESVKKNGMVHLKGLRGKVEEIKDRDANINTLNQKISNLTSKISQLELELKEEKKKPKREKKEIKLPESTTRKSSIRWVSQDERDIDNLYDD